MQKLFFATGNAGKVTSPRRVLAEYGIEVVQRKPEPDFIEIQAESAAAVAASKARQAFAQFGEPVMVIDSAFHVPALNGFPGIYVKPVTEQIGPEGYFKLLRNERGWADPACYFEDVIAYLDAGLPEPMTFSRKDWGTLVPDPLGPDRPGAKSPLWKVWIPKGFDRTIAQMCEAELLAYRSRPQQERFYHEFGEWLRANRLHR